MSINLVVGAVPLQVINIMEFEIRFFASLKDYIDGDRITVMVEKPATVATLIKAIGEEYPTLAALMKSSIVSVNHEFAFPELELAEGDEIAMFPPVSGGSDTRFPYPTYFAISAEPPDFEQIRQHLTQADVGALVSFTGTVRGQTTRTGLPAATTSLEYEAYAHMAENKMAQIATEIWQKWPNVRGIAIVQRIGKLGIGEITTYVACAAGHRDQDVFTAARYGIDRLKEIVPVWKKEIDGEQQVWVEGTYQPGPTDQT